MTADYQQAKDCHPDVATCRECGAVLEPDDTGWLCVTCEDMHMPAFSDDALTRRELREREEVENGY